MDEASVRQWYQEYLNAWASAVHGDLAERERVMSFYAFPLVVTSDRGARVVGSADEMLAFVKREADRLRPDGYSHTVALRADLISLNAKTTIYRGEISRRRTDGSEIARVDASYLIASGANGPRIYVIAGHSPK